jgi:hypothetical protein
MPQVIQINKIPNRQLGEHRVANWRHHTICLKSYAAFINVWPALPASGFFDKLVSLLWMAPALSRTIYCFGVLVGWPPWAREDLPVEASA